MGWRSKRQLDDINFTGSPFHDARQGQPIVAITDNTDWLFQNVSRIRLQTLVWKSKELVKKVDS
jgi:hypothetical protein